MRGRGGRGETQGQRTRGFPETPLESKGKIKENQNDHKPIRPKLGKKKPGKSKFRFGIGRKQITLAKQEPKNSKKKIQK